VRSVFLVGKKVPAGKVKNAPRLDITKNKHKNFLMMWFQTVIILLD
jgi:hypothetical protein